MTLIEPASRNRPAKVWTSSKMKSKPWYRLIRGTERDLRIEIFQRAPERGRIVRPCSSAKSRIALSLLFGSKSWPGGLLAWKYKPGPKIVVFWSVSFVFEQNLVVPPKAGSMAICA